MMENPKTTFNCRTKYGFAFGHIFNDMVSPIWFTYALLFYKMFYPATAFYFVVTGQIFDSVITFCIGFFFDAPFTSGRFFRLGKYTTWYCIGLLVLIISFPICFSELPMLVPTPATAVTLYLLCICLSQLAWSFCQIAHLSMINELSITSADRIWLTSSRQAASIYAAVVVFTCFWTTLQLNDGTRLSKSDIFVIANDSFYMTAVGVGHSIIFLFTVNEAELVRQKEIRLAGEEAPLITVDKSYEQKTSCGEEVHKMKTAVRSMDQFGTRDWFTDKTFYKICFVYMFARLYINLPVTYLILYIPETLFLNKTAIAFLPLVIFVSGFLSTFASNYIENELSNKYDLFFGILFGIVGGLWLIVGNCDNESFKSWQIYPVIVFLGISFSMVKISTLSLVSDMIGKNKKSTSFVYGAVSFFEKILSGTVIGLLESFGPNISIFRDPKVTTSTTTTSSSVIFDVSINGTMIISNDGSSRSLALWRVCSDGHYSNLYYYYIVSYGTLAILAFLLIGLALIAKVQIK